MLASAAGLGALGGLIAFIFVAGLYLLPTLVGWGRGVHDLGMVAVLNIFLGWTVIGWIVALALALRTPRQPQAQSINVDVHTDGSPGRG